MQLQRIESTVPGSPISVDEKSTFPWNFVRKWEKRGDTRNETTQQYISFHDKNLIGRSFDSNENC